MWSKICICICHMFLFYKRNSYLNHESYHENHRYARGNVGMVLNDKLMAEDWWAFVASSSSHTHLRRLFLTTGSCSSIPACKKRKCLAIYPEFLVTICNELIHWSTHGLDRKTHTPHCSGNCRKLTNKSQCNKAGKLRLINLKLRPEWYGSCL